jgi:hypothetical protein
MGNHGLPIHIGTALLGHLNVQTFHGPLGLSCVGPERFGWTQHAHSILCQIECARATCFVAEREFLDLARAGLRQGFGNLQPLGSLEPEVPPVFRTADPLGFSAERTGDNVEGISEILA